MRELKKKEHLPSKADRESENRDGLATRASSYTRLTTYLERR